MIELESTLLLMALVGVLVAWVAPHHLALDGVAMWTLLTLALISPLSALWLLGVAVLTPCILYAGDRLAQRNLPAAFAAMLLLAGFIHARLNTAVEWIGGAFFTLRALHVVGEWWMGRLATPTLRAHMRYQLFLPVVLSGPINRFDHFVRQVERRRFDAAQVFSGAERALLGAFAAFVIGNWALGRLAIVVADAAQTWEPFARAWMLSAVDWIALYFIFSGFTSMALGFSLMMGLKLEENFNRPWAARNLVDFWLRWHITLTSWVRDYVFRPVTALTRNVFAGLALSMIVIGMWHEFSAYYFLWSMWQVLGVALTHLAMRHLPLAALPPLAGALGGPLLVWAWLSLARPVNLLLLGDLK